MFINTYKYRYAYKGYTWEVNTYKYRYVLPMNTTPIPIKINVGIYCL